MENGAKAVTGPTPAVQQLASIGGYSALIRTFNSERTLPATLSCLARQQEPPSGLVVIDSGSTDGTLAALPEWARARKYRGEQFNYSEALNQGIEQVDSEFVLIISSHTSLQNPQALRYALELLRTDDRLGAICFIPVNDHTLSHELIGRTEFTGFNGLANTCALYRTALLRERPFRPEVLAAEDQEWTRWLLVERQKQIARISGAGLVYANPRKESFRKRLNEYVSIAYYCNQELLRPQQMLRLLGGAANFRRKYGVRERIYYLVLVLFLLRCRLGPPQLASKYF